MSGGIMINELSGIMQKQRFFIGESDSEDEEHSVRGTDVDSWSIESDITDEATDVIGGAPSTLPFVIGDDDDSGVGAEFIAGLSIDDEEPLPLVEDAPPSPLLPLKNVTIGAKSVPTKLTNDSPMRRYRKRSFFDYYELVNDSLGNGAYASVRTARSLTTGKEYAVKLVDKHVPGHTRNRILREVEVFKLCRDHPNIVQLIEWFDDRDYYYLVMEKMNGGTLLAHLTRKGTFTEQEASLVTKNIATALLKLHSLGIAHRDLKPENILCPTYDCTYPVKLCDLDLASKPRQCKKKKNNAHTLPSAQSVPDLTSPVGSVEFVAPEVVDAFVGGDFRYSKRCDLWSLGCLLYICLCGYTPYYGECYREDCGWNQGQSCDDCQESLFRRIQDGEFDYPPEEWSHISAEAKDLISHLLVKDARSRYTAEEVLNHPWIMCGAPKTPLQTCSNLIRNESARDIRAMNEHFNLILNPPGRCI